MKSTFDSRTAIAASLIYCMISLTPGGLFAQNPPPPRNAQLSVAELDQLGAPIALYPDALVAQILVATTYSPQVVEADRFLQHNADLPPQEVARLADTQKWDPSVKALTAFPSVLANLDRNLEWTTKLGDAYYNQPQDVMSAVQTMRDRAHKSGALHAAGQRGLSAGNRRDSASCTDGSLCSRVQSLDRLRRARPGLPGVRLCTTSCSGWGCRRRRGGSLRRRLCRFLRVLSLGL